MLRGILIGYLFHCCTKKFDPWKGPERKAICTLRATSSFIVPRFLIHGQIATALPWSFLVLFGLERLSGLDQRG